MQVAQEEIDKDHFNEDKKKKAITILEEYTEVSIDELKLLHQKAKINWLREGDKNTAYFHNILKARKHKNRVESICDDNGGHDVAIQFERHFQKFLGTSNQVMPLEQLGDIVQLKLNTEDAEAMILEVSDNEIKDAMFDTDSSKASMEFFSKGKLLKEVNATLVALVPNSLLQWRHIQDNILLTQELLRGYNRKQGAKRCAMKIDIQKAYDSWKFLEDVFKEVGFHQVMINWIMICISTASFSICINGEVCGYFKGGRGLRQGDPMSPYLFSLVMEVLNMIMIKNIKDDSRFKYHYGCKELELTHLCFADDLLMLCNGDVDSLKVMKKSLEEFSKVSGLFPNHSKSTIFFGSMLENKKQELLEIMPFKCEKLPMKYLGVPLLSKRLGVNDCKCLIESVERRIKCWRNRVLSYAGRIQLIASVLASMQNYWAYVYLLPNTVVMELEKLFRRFIWNLGDSAKDKVKPHVFYKIGNDRNISAWHDKWCQMGPLDRINWPDGWVEDFPELNQIPNPVIDANATDKVCWVNSDYKEVDFSTKRKLMTQDRIMRWQQGAILKCPLCNVCSSTVATQLRFGIGLRLIVSATVYFIWQERNKRIFQSEKRTPKVLCRNVEESIVSMLRALNVKKSNADWVFGRRNYFVDSINFVVSLLWMDVLETIECCEVLVPWSYPGKCNHKDMVSGESSELLIRFAAWSGIPENGKYQRSYKRYGLIWAEVFFKRVWLDIKWAYSCVSPTCGCPDRRFEGIWELKKFVGNEELNTPMPTLG
ncbi:RNA-directed DNA polymerase, eukaryota, reverse transcriptase zinc-binding domain protein [Tanacetum coccineum]